MYYFEIYRDQANYFRWRLKAPNRKIIADGSEGYNSLQNVRIAIALVKRVVGTARVVDLTQRR
ncbi:MAG: DUF1508 domain-containing protein [bacterium]